MNFSFQDVNNDVSKDPLTGSLGVQILCDPLLRSLKISFTMPFIYSDNPFSSPFSKLKLTFIPSRRCNNKLPVSADDS